MRVDADEAGLIERMCQAFPVVEGLRQEHVRYFEEMIPVLFLGEVAERAIALHGEGSPASRRELADLCAFLEKEHERGPESVRDLIFLGFLENLGGPPQPEWRVRECLGPRLRQEIEAMWPSQGAPS